MKFNSVILKTFADVANNWQTVHCPVAISLTKTETERRNSVLATGDRDWEKVLVLLTDRLICRLSAISSVLHLSRRSFGGPAARHGFESTQTPRRVQVYRFRSCRSASDDDREWCFVQRDWTVPPTDGTLAPGNLTPRKKPSRTSAGVSPLPGGR